MYKAISLGCIGHAAPFHEAAPILHRHGAEGVWLSLTPDVMAMPERTRSILQDNGLRFAGFNAAVPWSAAEHEDFGLLRAQAQYAERMGVTRAVTGIMPFSDTMDFAENYAFHLKRYRESVKVLASFGIRLGVEFIGVPSIRNGHKYAFLKNMDEMLAFLADVDPDNTGLLLDLFHFETAGHRNEELLKLRDEQIVLVHIMDAPNVPMEEQQDLVRALPGSTGVLHIGGFFDALTKISYSGPVLPEPFDKSLAEMPLEAAIQTAMGAVDRVWPEK